MPDTDPAPHSYNQIAGQSVERLAALSDGIFGVAMTLLLLDLHVPAKELIHSEAGLLRAVIAMLPLLLVYLMSFISLGIFWVSQQTQLNHLAHSDRHLTWLHLAFLFGVTLMPFSTRLLTDFIAYRTALLIYWGNMLLLGVMLYCCWARTTRRGLLKDHVPAQVQALIYRRIIVTQTVFALGASLCVFSTYLSIAVIVLLQLHYAVAIIPSKTR
jgi:uncharacterized membrane protein